MVHLGNGKQSIIANLLLSVGLLAFDDADQAGADSDAGEGRFIHEKQDVDRVAVRAEGPGQESEVVREAHASRKTAFTVKMFCSTSKAEFVATALGGFNDDLD